MRPRVIVHGPCRRRVLSRCRNGPAPEVLSGTGLFQSDGATGGPERFGSGHQEGWACSTMSGSACRWSGAACACWTPRVVREAKVASEPEALVGFLRGLGLAIARVGLEAGPLSQWLHDGLREAGHDVVLLETRHVKAALSAMAVKTDRRDAHGELWRSVRLRQAKFLNNIIETVPMCVVTNGL